MSLSSKARTQLTFASQYRAMQKNISILYSRERLRATPQSIQQPQYGTSPPSTPEAYSLKRNGDAMTGPFGLTSRITTNDILGNIDIGITGAFSSNVLLTTPAGSSDIRSITGMINDGQILFLSNATGVDLALRQATFSTDNISTITGSDILFLFGDIIILIWNAGFNRWEQVTAGTTAFGSGANTSLSNLTSPTTINQHLIPQANKNLGSQANWWNVEYLNDLKLLDTSDPNNKFTDIGYNPATHFIEYDITSTINAGHIFMYNGHAILGVEGDNTFGDFAYADFYQAHIYTSASFGSASALPATPQGYLIVMINGARRKIPYYNV